MIDVVLQNRGSAPAAACGMECGVAASGYPAPPAPPPRAPLAPLSPSERSPAKSGLHVNFSDKGEVCCINHHTEALDFLLRPSSEACLTSGNPQLV